MVKKISALLVIALMFTLFQPWVGGNAYADEFVKKASKDVFIDYQDTYPTGADASGLSVGLGNVNFIGPDFDYGAMKTAVNFSSLQTGLPQSFSKVTLRLYVPFILVNPATDPGNPQDVRLWVNGSTNVGWDEDLGNSRTAFPASDDPDNNLLSLLQNLKVADKDYNTSHKHYLDTSGECAPASHLLGCLNLDVTNYVQKKIADGRTDITFTLVGREELQKTWYFTIYPNENATYAPRLIFEGQSNQAPTGITLTGGQVSEDAAIGTSVGTLSASDPDAGDTFTYSLVSGAGSTDNDSFSIVGDEVKTNAALDFEKGSPLSIRVRVTDSANNTFEKQLAITVTDVNEAPTDLTLSNDSVAEGTASGSIVGTLSTVDFDAGESFTYELTSGAGDTDNGDFQVTGNSLKIAVVPDYEAKETYDIRVKVTDSVGHEFEKQFTINVTNVNETPTDIALSSDSISENAAAGSQVGLLSATDPDRGDTFTYTLVSGEGDSDNGSFQIVGNKLQTKETLDFEQQNSYNIRVRVEDSGGLAYEKEFTITIIDGNDAPTDLALTPASVEENQPVGTEVGSFSTVDSNMGDTFTYTLVSGGGHSDNDSFTIDGDKLKTSEIFDYETKNTYSIQVRATDSGGLSYDKELTITIIDGNDPPTDLALTPASVEENEPAGTEVGSFSTVDSNVGDTFTYALVSGEGASDNGSFTIDGDTLKTNEIFDYETKNTYSIRVRVTDNGGLNYDKELTIAIVDGNDAPTDLALTPAGVAENEASGTTVGTLTASDIDPGDTFTYSLVSGEGDTDNGSFSIVGDEVKTNGVLDFETKSSYSIRVKVTDSANNTFEKQLTIAVTDVNEVPSGTIAFEAGTTTTTSEVMLKLTSSDPEGDSREMRFSNNGSDWSGWEPYAATKLWSLSGPDGSKTVYMELRDSHSLQSEAVQASIFLDATAPTGTIAILHGDEVTRHKQVELEITSTDGDGSGGVKVRFSNDNQNWSDWEDAPVPGTRAWTLEDGRGEKTVYMQLMDQVGHISASISDSILFSSIPTLANAGKSGRDNSSIPLSVTDFVYDNEDGTGLQTVTLVTLPEHGVINLNNVPVTAGQIVSYADVGQLAYVPQRGFSGTAKLAWIGSDGENEAAGAAEIAFTLTAESRSSGASSGPQGPAAADEQEAVIVKVNGVVQEQLATAKTTIGPDGKKISTITIDEQKMNAKLEREGKRSVVTIPFTKEADKVMAVLNGQMVKSMEQKEAVLQIETKNASYRIQASQINIDAIVGKMNQQVPLKDIEVSVEITLLSDTDPMVAVQRKKNDNVTIVAPSVDFKLTGSYNGQTVEVHQFNAYVERSIAVPDGVDPQKITTGVAAMPDGTFVHVPTKVIQNSGHYAAVINSLTNSTYSVIYNYKTFADVESHWSKEVVDEMASRLVINGVDTNTFAPDQAITRAEFAAIVTRALGLRELHQAAAFNDVHSSDWYYNTVSIAQEYGLIQGYSESAFEPNQLITREEAMVIVKRALILAGAESSLTSSQIESALGMFQDKDSFQDWSKSAAALCMKLGIVEGSEGTARPASHITRAETAAIIKRMLEAAKLI